MYLFIGGQFLFQVIDHGQRDHVEFMHGTYQLPSAYDTDKPAKVESGLVLKKIIDVMERYHHPYMFQPPDHPGIQQVVIGNGVQD
jgi:hypothetical protein